MFRKDSMGRRGGGVLLFIKDTILYLDQSCLVSVQNIAMSYLILNIWVLIAVVLPT